MAWLLGLAGLAAVGYGTFRPWHDGRAATDLPIADLFSGIHPEPAALLTSMAVPLLLGGLLALIGLLLSATALRAGAAVLLLAALAWLYQYGGIDGLQVGYWNTAFGALLVVVSATVKP
jgi:hypothetical protein